MSGAPGCAIRPNWLPLPVGEGWREGPSVTATAACTTAAATRNTRLPLPVVEGWGEGLRFGSTMRST